MNTRNIIILAIAAFVLGTLAYPPLRKFRFFVSNKYHFIKNYWIFSILFIVGSFFSYFFTLKNSLPNHIDTNITVVSTSLTLIFAIFVSYFAFAAVVENRLDKFKERGDQYMNRDRDYPRAIVQYEEAYKISSKDPDVLMNLLEAYLIEKSTIKFAEFFPSLDKIALEGKERLTAHYLLVTKECLHKIWLKRRLN